MSIESNKILVRRYFDELLNQGKLNIAEEIFHPDIVFCDPFVTIRGIDRMQRFILMVRKTFPDLHYTVDPGIAEGDRVVSCFTSSGTFLAESYGPRDIQSSVPVGKKTST